jgi:hypothetical protein
LDCLHWHLTTQALKDEISDASPSGILNHLSIHTTTMIIDYKIFNENEPIYHNTIKDKAL